MTNELIDSSALCVSNSGNKTTLQLGSDFETAWMSQDALADFFGITKVALRKELLLVLKNLDKSLHVRRVHFVKSQGDDRASKIGYESQYSLGVILQLALRIHSDVAEQIREWMLSISERVITKGFFIDKQRLKQKESRVELFLKQAQNLK
jgi:hypothetical protein